MSTGGLEQPEWSQCIKTKVFLNCWIILCYHYQGTFPHINRYLMGRRGADLGTIQKRKFYKGRERSLVICLSWWNQLKVSWFLQKVWAKIYCSYPQKASFVYTFNSWPINTQMWHPPCYAAVERFVSLPLLKLPWVQISGFECLYWLNIENASNL